MQTDAFPNHGYDWIAAAESDAAHAAESDLMSQGYLTAFHAIFHAWTAAHGGAPPPSWSSAPPSQLEYRSPRPAGIPDQYLWGVPSHDADYSVGGHSHAGWSHAPHHGRRVPAPAPPLQDYPSSHASVAGALQPGGWPDTAPPPVPHVVHVDTRGQGGSGASTPPSVATTTVSSSTGTRLPSASDFPLASHIPCRDHGLRHRPPYRGERCGRNRIGTDSKWVAFNRSLTQSLEMDCFTPGSDDLVTTPSNRVQSTQLRTALYAALSKAAAARFDSRDKLRGKGFEMVAILREAYAPTGEDAIFPNFRSLFSLEQDSKEELSTYMARICTIKGKLKAGGIDLPPILLNMFTVKCLRGAYSAVKREFALKSGLFSSLDLEGIELKCDNFASALTATGNEEEDTYASAAGRGSTAAPVPSPQPAAPVAGGNRPVFPPARPPPGHKVTALMAKASTECPLCHQKHHGLATCGYALRAGYVCQHKPMEVATQLTALNLGGGRSAAATQPAGEHPSASITRASPASPPPVPSPPTPTPAPAPPKPLLASTVDTDVQAAAAEIMLEEVSITDDETSLMEADSILPQGTANNNRSGAVATCAVAPASSSLTPLAQACAAVTRQPARLLTSSPCRGHVDKK